MTHHDRGAFRVRAILSALVLAALLSGLVAAAADAGVDGADYVVWRFPAGGARGLGLIRGEGSNATFVAETVGLQRNAPYRLVGSTSWCGDIHQPTHAVWSNSFESNGKGASYTNSVLGDHEEQLTLRSVRLLKGSTEVDCAKAVKYRSSGGGPSDAFASINAFGARALVFVDHGRSDKLTAVGHGFIASHGYRLVGSDVACPEHPAAGSTLFERSGTTSSQGILWRHEKGTNLSNKAPRSIQLFNGSRRVACAPTTMLAP